jgi:nucleosome binding factor SPN SPT16 subunit
MKLSRYMVKTLLNLVPSARYDRKRLPSILFQDDGPYPELSAADCFVCAVGNDEEMVYSKSTSIQTWLFGYELPDTILLFCDSAIYVLSSKKKIDFFRQIEKLEGVPSVKLLVRDKTDNDKRNFQCLIEAVKESRNGSTLGVIAKDQNYPGSFMDGWRSQLSRANLATSDVSAAFTFLMAPKEEVELSHIRKASQVTSDVFSKYLKEQIMDIIDSDKVCSSLRFT